MRNKNSEAHMNISPIREVVKKRPNMSAIRGGGLDPPPAKKSSLLKSLLSLWIIPFSIRVFMHFFFIIISPSFHLLCCFLDFHPLGKKTVYKHRSYRPDIFELQELCGLPLSTYFSGTRKLYNGINITNYLHKYN